ncbi:MAG: alpha/beta hydrolase [Candidatus Micrarchaeaceae archaeon]
MAEFEDKFVETSFGKIHARLRHGDEKCIYFVHGLGASLLSWSLLVPLLPQSLGICLVDLLGHGKSDAPEGPYSLDLQAKALIELSKSIGKPSFLFGHSYGALVALEYAIQERLEKLIIEDCADIGSIANIAKSSKENEFINRNPMLLAANRRVIKSIIENSIKERQFNTEILGKIAAPTLIICGENDSVASIEKAAELKASIKESSLAIISGAGHVPHYTHPCEVAKRLVEFLGK